MIDTLHSWQTTGGINRISPVRTSPAAWVRPLMLRWCRAICLMLSIGIAWPPGAAAVDSSDDETSTYRINIRRLEHGIRQQKDQLLATAHQERNILAELEVLDQRLTEQLQKLSELEEKILGQQHRIDLEETALQAIRKEKARVEEHLQNRATAYYTMGSSGLLNVMFSTKNLAELLTFNDAFDTLISYDQQVIRVYRETIAEVERARNALALEKVVLQDFFAQAQGERENLEQTKKEKHELLGHVRTQTRLHQQAAQEMEQASQELAQALVATQNRPQADSNGFAANRGALPPPVRGVLLTLFQQERINKLGISRKSQGIELQAEEEAAVVAVAAGEVIFSGYLRGYGNAIIIDHGDNYFTVTARLERTVVEKGQRVVPEQQVGMVGVAATLFDDGLYFEIRHGKQSQDPLLWLDPKKIVTSEELDS